MADVQIPVRFGRKPRVDAARILVRLEILGDASPDKIQ
jgi:hypothetical protein